MFEKVDKFPERRRDGVWTKYTAALEACQAGEVYCATMGKDFDNVQVFNNALRYFGNMRYWTVKIRNLDDKCYFQFTPAEP